MKKRKEKKEYIFTVDSHLDRNSSGAWIKTATLSDEEGNEFRAEETTISAHYPKYTCAMKFNDDNEAVAWFNSHYKGFLF